MSEVLLISPMEGWNCVPLKIFEATAASGSFSVSAGTHVDAPKGMPPIKLQVIDPCYDKDDV